MKRFEIKKALEEKYGMLLLTKEVAAYFRADRHSVPQLMEGYKSVKHGKKRLWHAQDVAEVADEKGVMA